jgi:hypothetical protein
LYNNVTDNLLKTTLLEIIDDDGEKPSMRSRDIEEVD